MLELVATQISLSRGGDLIGSSIPIDLLRFGVDVVHFPQFLMAIR